MEKSHSSRYLNSSPAKSGSKAVSSPLPEAYTLTLKSKKTRKNGEEDSSGSSDDSFVSFLRRSDSNMVVPRRTRSASTSPSAWAMSPGRTLPSSSPAPPVPKHPKNSDKLVKSERKSSGSSMGGVLKYFRQKKVSSTVLETEYHQYRVVYNRLLQWRFVNARGEESMANVRKIAQKKLWNGFGRINVLRKLIVEKRMKIEKLKHDIKKYHIFESEMKLLNEWAKLEPKNMEAVGRVVRKLSAISLCLPLVHDAEADVMSVNHAITAAIEVMESIQAIIMDKMHLQVEQMCFLLTELSVILKQEKEFFHELQNRISMVASLEVEERSIRIHQFQLVM